MESEREGRRGTEGWSASLSRRGGVLLLIVGFAFLALSVRLFDVQILAHETYETRKAAQGHRVVEIREPRGSILDLKGEILAMSVPAPSIYAVPRRVKDPQGLSKALGVDVAPKLRDGKHFVWLKRRVTGEEAAVAKRFAGVDVRMEHLRRYPHGNLLSHLLGLTNVDDEGIDGLEAALDRSLRGESARGAVEVDGLVRRLSFPEGLNPGADVRLTIPLLFQKVVEEELDAVVLKYQPKWATVVAIDPATGAIRAIANRPAFDPNGRADETRTRRNMALIGPVEPGSTWKPFCVAAALEEKLITPESVIDCEMGQWKRGERVLHDHDPYGRLSVNDIVVKSSNIGAAKIGVLLGEKRLWKWADAFGFGRATGFELPEDRGSLKRPEKWSGFTITSIPMGHEISVTALQLAVAMSVLANGGRLVKPYVIDSVADADGGVSWRATPEVIGEVMSARTCEAMRKILVEVVRNGTGKKAEVAGVAVAGKTGTSQKVDPATGRYTSTKHISLFTGFAPAVNPKVCLAVIIDEPQGEYYGGAVAAPVMGNIIRRGLAHLE